MILRKPRLDQGADYERGFVDGMQYQMQSSVDKAVNATPQRTEQNFCPRCGKRTNDIHTCTPPQRTEQEPVAWMKPDVLCDRACMYLCTKGFTQFPECATIHPPQRTWVGLTDEDAEEVWQSVQASDFHDCVKPFAQGIEAKLKEKNNA
jgi:hypothetical protein